MQRFSRFGPRGGAQLKACALIMASLTCGVAAANDEIWRAFSWSPLATDPDGAQHFLAPASLLRLPHAPHMMSFYRKIVFPEAREMAGVVADSEIAEMAIDCQSGRMDVLSQTALYQGEAVSRRVVRQENARRVKLNTLGEDALRQVCGDTLPRYVRRKDNPPPIGSDPAGLRR